VRQALKSFGRRYLCQLQVLPGRALLLSLGEEGVNAHRLPHFKVTAQATRTRSVSLSGKNGSNACHFTREKSHTSKWLDASV
jgi:hypothetical protein